MIAIAPRNESASAPYGRQRFRSSSPVRDLSRPGHNRHYSERLTEGAFKHPCLFALDPYEIALAKLERNNQRGRDDVKHLARVLPFDLGILRERYETELKPFLRNPDRESLTLRLWTEAIEEDRQR